MNELINGVDKDLKLKLQAIKDNYQIDTGYMIKFLDTEGLKFNREGLEKYVEYLKSVHTDGKRYSARTINKRIACIKNRLEYIFDNMPPEFQDRVSEYKFEKYLKTFEYVKVNSFAIDRERILSEKEIQKLIDNADTRLSLMIRFLDETGVRISEMCNILVFDCRKRRDHVDIRILGKKQKERIIYLDFDLFNEIRKEFKGKIYLFEHNSKQYSTKATTIRIFTLTEKVLGKHRTAHDFRHIAATRLLKKYTLGAVSRYLGHSDPAITAKIYDNNNLAFSDIKKISEEKNKKRNRG